MSQHDRSQSHRDRLVWGVVLIAVGVIFLLQNVMGLDVWDTVWKFWPADPHPVGRPEAHRRAAETQGPERTGFPVRSQAGLTMRAREIFLALLIIFGGVFLYYAQTGRLNLDGEGWDGFFGSRGEEFVFESSQEIAGPRPRPPGGSQRPRRRSRSRPPGPAR